METPIGKGAQDPSTASPFTATLTRYCQRHSQTPGGTTPFRSFHADPSNGAAAPATADMLPIAILRYMEREHGGCARLGLQLQEDRVALAWQVVAALDESPETRDIYETGQGRWECACSEFYDAVLASSPMLGQTVSLVHPDGVACRQECRAGRIEEGGYIRCLACGKSLTYYLFAVHGELDTLSIKFNAIDMNLQSFCQLLNHVNLRYEAVGQEDNMDAGFVPSDFRLQCAADAGLGNVTRLGWPQQWRRHAACFVLAAVIAMLVLPWSW